LTFKTNTIPLSLLQSCTPLLTQKFKTLKLSLKTPKTFLRERRAEIMKDEAYLEKVFKAGCEKIRSVVEAKMADVRKKVGMEF
jgi:hypothetical protein